MRTYFSVFIPNHLHTYRGTQHYWPWFTVWLFCCFPIRRNALLVLSLVSSKIVHWHGTRQQQPRWPQRPLVKGSSGGSWCVEDTQTHCWCGTSVSGTQLRYHHEPDHWTEQSFPLISVSALPQCSWAYIFAIVSLVYGLIMLTICVVHGMYLHGTDVNNLPTSWYLVRVSPHHYRIPWWLTFPRRRAATSFIETFYASMFFSHYPAFGLQSMSPLGLSSLLHSINVFKMKIYYFFCDHACHGRDWRSSFIWICRSRLSHNVISGSLPKLEIPLSCTSSNSCHRCYSLCSQRQVCAEEFSWPAALLHLRRLVAFGMNTYSCIIITV